MTALWCAPSTAMMSKPVLAVPITDTMTDGRRVASTNSAAVVASGGTSSMKTNVGLCECGCGGTPRLASHTDRRFGHVKGQPVRFILGHATPRSGYVVEDRGYTTPCWVWLGRPTDEGYGRARQRGRHAPAHRVIYEEVVGPIPAGLTIDHLCRVRLCVNPDHLEPVPIRENVLRGNGPSAIHARKTHCERGHEFTPANTYVRPSRRGLPDGGRVCRICQRLRRSAAWRNAS